MIEEDEDAWLRAARRRFATRIHGLRTDRELSQEKLAELSGLDRKTVNRIEGGRHAITLDNLHRLARGLNVTPANLLDQVRIGPEIP